MPTTTLDDRPALHAVCSRIGARLRAIREASGLTAEVVSSRIGISRVSITQIENGKQSPSLDSLVLLADALGVALSDLFAEEQTVDHVLYAKALETKLRTQASDHARAILDLQLSLERKACRRTRRS